MGSYRPETHEHDTGPIEQIVEKRPDGRARIVRRRFPEKRWQDWIVEFCGDAGIWTRSSDGPWDFISNARIEMDMSRPFNEPSFAELIERNHADGGCGCAPGTILCPH